MMTETKTVCVVTGSRAEFGLLAPVIDELRSNKFNVQLLVTGSHLSDSHGQTQTEIEGLGYRIDSRVPMELLDDSSQSVILSMGNELIGLSTELSRLAPDAVVVLGDRYEIAVVALAVVILKIPLFHIGGGDQTLGSYDDTLRHMVTKAAQLHLVSNETSWRRVRQMGEDPANIFNTGSTIVDNVRNLRLLGEKELAGLLGIELVHPVLAVSMHPLTSSAQDSMTEMNELLLALNEFQRHHRATVVITGSNADNGGAQMNRLWSEFVAQARFTSFHQSLGRLAYLSLVAHSDVCVGNSSSGIIEAPYLRVPTVNIGDRQLGRNAPESVIHTPANALSIFESIRTALEFKDWSIPMIYGDEPAAPRIVEAIVAWFGQNAFRIKPFHFI